MRVEADEAAAGTKPDAAARLLPLGDRLKIPVLDDDSDAGRAGGFGCGTTGNTLLSGMDFRTR
jgi:hypothetical protein